MNQMVKTMSKILLIEDEDNIRKMVAYDLKCAGYEVDESKDGKDALNKISVNEYDLMIIDWQIPYISGIEIVNTVRSQKKDAVLFMMTARDDEEDILYAFETGVDDYITKPFSPRELVARVNAHLKRKNKKNDNELTLGDIRISLQRRCVHVKDEEISLTKKEFDLLEYMLKNKGIVMSRDNILNDIWGFDYDGDTRIVDVHIFKLRNKLSGCNVSILSTRGVGYVMELKNGKE